MKKFLLLVLFLIASHAFSQSLKLLSPNGGESFVGGSDVLIQWENSDKNALFQLEYSLDSGRTWIYLDTTRKFTYTWKNTPTGKSPNCLLKIKHLKYLYNSTNDTIRTLREHNNGVLCVAYSPNGKTIASGGWDGVKIWNASTGSLLRNLNSHTDVVLNVKYNPKGNILISGSADSSIKTGI